MRLRVLAAEHSRRAVPRALARGIAERDRLGFHDKVERDAEPAAELAVAAGIRQELVMAEMQGKARFRNLDAAELQPPTECHSPIDDQPSPPADAPPPGRA